MKRAQVVALVLMSLLALLIALLVLRGRQAPRLPRDDVHAVFDRAETCLSCHGPQSVAPRSKNHPLGLDCLRCHGAG